MSPDRIRQTLKETPFKPFSVHTGDGSSVDVLSPEFAFLYPGGRTLLVSVPKKPGAKDEGDFEEHRIDVFFDHQTDHSAATECEDEAEKLGLSNFHGEPRPATVGASAGAFSGNRSDKHNACHFKAV